MAGNPLLHSRTPRLGAGLPLGSLDTRKGRGPGHFAAGPRYPVLGWRKQGAPKKVSLYPP